MIVDFYDFINEGVNYETSESGEIEFTGRWFYFDMDDEIIYGSDDIPTDENYPIIFNPKTCEVFVGGEKMTYDVNNPVCLISYNLEEDEIKMYSDNVYDFLESFGYDGDNDFISPDSRRKIRKLFDENEDEYRFILIYGTKLIASTFDIIEEN